MRTMDYTSKCESPSSSVRQSLDDCLKRCIASRGERLSNRSGFNFSPDLSPNSSFLIKTHKNEFEPILKKRPKSK